MAEAKQVDFLLTGLRHPLTDEPLAGGAVWTYEAGTSTPASLYLDRDTTEGTHTNPIILDSFGRAEAFGDGVYKFVVRATDEETDPILFEVDNLEYVAELDEGGVGPLTTDLDFNFNKGINVAAGTVAGDIVEYQQFTTAIADLTSDINNVQGNLDAATFTSIGQTPDSLSGHALKLVRVNTGATALEFIPIADIDPDKSFLDLTDTPANYTSAGGKTLRVKADASGIEFTDDPAVNKAFTDLTDVPASYTGAAGKFVKVKSTENGLEFVAAPTGDVPIGSVIMYAGAGSPPTGWLECAGQSLDAADYPDLATALGVSWGAGGGVGEFRLPDFRGLVPMGAGTNDKTLTGIADTKGGAYAGGSVGAYSADTMQGHDHSTPGVQVAVAGSFDIHYAGNKFGSSVNNTKGVIADEAGLYGTPRLSHITKPATAAIKFIIRAL